MLSLYKNIKKRREELGISQEELARLAGYTSRSSIAKIEKGEVDLSIKKINQISNALQIPSHDLVGWDEGLELVDTDIIADIMTNPDDLDHVQKLVNLNSTSKSIVYNMIDALYDKEEGH